MVKAISLNALLVTALFLTSCSALMFRPQELAHPIELARARALSEPVLDAISREMMRTNAPRVSYYKIAGDFCQYTFTWRITDKRTISVFGEGDIKQIEGSKVSISRKE